MPMLTKKQKDAMRNEHYNSLQGSLASLKMFAAQIRLARVEMVRGEEVDISLCVGDKTIYCRITRDSFAGDDVLELMYGYVRGQIDQANTSIAEMNYLYPDLPQDVSAYPVVISLNPFEIVPPKRRKRGLKAIFAAIADMPIWLLTGKRPG